VLAQQLSCEIYLPFRWRQEAVLFHQDHLEEWVHQASNHLIRYCPALEGATEVEMVAHFEGGLALAVTFPVESGTEHKEDQGEES
jgi:hypothetical protein